MAKQSDDHGADCPDVGWQQYWDARKQFLESMLGSADDQIVTSFIPIYLGAEAGGKSDVMTFRNHVKGCTYVTAGLTGNSEQPETDIGQYELMLCTREESEEAPVLLADLSNYSLRTPIRRYDTIDFGP